MLERGVERPAKTRRPDLGGGPFSLNASSVSSSWSRHHTILAVANPHLLSDGALREESGTSEDLITSCSKQYTLSCHWSARIAVSDMDRGEIAQRLGG